MGQILGDATQYVKFNEVFFSLFQPLCDGAHKQLDGTNFKKLPNQFKFRPHRFVVEETKDYWLCNCKQTGNAPFCDGTHKRQDIQDAIRS